MLTLLQIMDHALSQAQMDSSFRPEARQWYNIIVNKLAAYTDYPFYRKSVDIPYVAGQRRYALPADFKNADEAYELDTQGNTSTPIPMLDAYMFRQMEAGNVSGSASVAYVDTATNELVINSAPNSGNTTGVRLFYYKSPAQVNLGGSDDASIPDFKDQQLLIEEMKAMAYEFRNDERYIQKKQEAKMAKMEFERNMYQDDSYSVIPLNSVHFRSGSRRSRGRGFRA
jgi:hypothetical protein